MTLRVNNLPPQVTEANLTELFSEYGSIERIEIFVDKTAAFVTLSGDQEEDAAISALNGKEWRGNTLELAFDAEDNTRDPGGPPPGGSGSGSSGSGDSVRGGSTRGG